MDPFMLAAKMEYEYLALDSKDRVFMYSYKLVSLISSAQKWEDATGEHIRVFKVSRDGKGVKVWG